MFGICRLSSPHSVLQKKAAIEETKNSADELALLKLLHREPTLSIRELASKLNWNKNKVHRLYNKLRGKPFDPSNNDLTAAGLEATGEGEEPETESNVIKEIL